MVPRTAKLAAALIAFCLAAPLLTASPAMADGDRWRGEWREHHDRGRWERERWAYERRYVPPPQVVYVQPEPRYVYVPPPPSGINVFVPFN